jgi:chemotaxis protein methyltransferase WspC
MITEIANLLERTMGLDVAVIGSSTIERAVDARLSACNLNDAEAYLKRVRSSEIELLELIEAVVVPETWFFRQYEAFVALTAMIYKAWLPTHSTGVLRLLSLPCSTGEEPYSIAMALLDVGVPADRFQIDAVDISERALAIARLAEYGKNSFRGNNLGFRDRHFILTQGRWWLSDAARAQVRFQHGNIFSTAFLPGVEIYDVIFCRNMLIYFGREVQDRAVAVLLRLLTGGGTLFVGPSETGLFLRHNLVSANVPMAFAFHKATAISPQTAPRGPIPGIGPSFLRSHLPLNPIFFKPAAMEDRPYPIRASSEPKIRPEMETWEAALLADQGRLVEAAKSCQEHISKHGASAQAFYLLGLIHDAGGNLTKAVQYYRKALYLDQYHHLALSHLALLLLKQGDSVGARILRDRMIRVEQKGVK